MFNIVNIKLLSESNTEDSTVSWHKVNREKLNEVVRAFNQFQVAGFPSHQREVVRAMIARCREYGEANTFADWQFQELDVMSDHLNATRDVPDTSAQVSATIPYAFMAQLMTFAAQLPEEHRTALTRMIDDAAP